MNPFYRVVPPAFAEPRESSDWLDRTRRALHALVADRAAEVRFETADDLARVIAATEIEQAPVPSCGVRAVMDVYATWKSGNRRVTAYTHGGLIVVTAHERYMNNEAVFARCVGVGSVEDPVARLRCGLAWIDFGCSGFDVTEV